MKHPNNAIKISGSGTLISALSVTWGIGPSSDERKRGRQKGGKKKRRKEKEQKKNGRTYRDCLDMHVTLAVGLKIRQLSGGILASSWIHEAVRWTCVRRGVTSLPLSPRLIILERKVFTACRCVKRSDITPYQKWQTRHPANYKVGSSACTEYYTTMWLLLIYILFKLKL